MNSEEFVSLHFNWIASPLGPLFNHAVGEGINQ